MAVAFTDFALGSAFLGAGCLATVFLAKGFGGLLGTLGEVGFFSISFAAFLGSALASLEWSLAAGLETFAGFFAAVVLAAGRDGLFEEVVFVFNLLSVRLGEKADEHPPHGS